MASLEPNSNNQSSFSNTPMDHPPLSSAAPPCFPTPDFGDHFTPGKLHQELAAAQPWQNPSAHLEKPNKIPGSSFLFADGGRLLPAFAGMDSYGNPSSEFVDSAELAGVSWDGKLAYMLPPASHGGNSLVGNLSGHAGLMDGAALVRQIAPPTAAGTNDKRGPSPSFVAPFLMGASPPLSEMEKLLSSSNWSSLNPTPVDPTPQGGCLPMSAMSIAAPSCLANFSTDPGFVERAAKFSSFSNNNRPYSELIQPYPAAGDGGKDPPRSVKASQAKTTRGSSGYHTPRCSAPNSPIACNSAAQELNNGSMAENIFHQAALEGTVSLIMDDPKLGLEKRSSRSSSRVDVGEVAQKRCMSVNESDESMCQEVSSSCERNGGYEAASQGANENPGKKRRTGLRDRSSKTDTCAASVKDVDIDEPKASHRQSCDGATEEGSKAKVEPSQSANSDDSTPKSVKESSKPPEAPKPDYIHVRARRGQATDSHSLAERVRREKISERMKFLQDLVPGCSKVTGKAVMLDEIINYVQSLQQQVEFLSMKLAAVNPRPDFNIESLFGREPRVASQTMVFAPENASPFPSLHQQQPPQPALQVGSCGPMDVHTFGRDPMLRTLSTPLASADSYTESVSQMVQAWDNELQSVVQMSFVQGRQTPLSSPSLQGNTGQLFPGQMKVEL